AFAGPIRKDRSAARKDAPRSGRIHVGDVVEQAVGLADAPGDAAVCAGKLLDDADVGWQVELGAPQRPRLEQAKQASVDEGLDEVRWKRTVLLDLVGDRLDARPELTRGRDKLLAGRRSDHVHLLEMGESRSELPPAVHSRCKILRC